MFITYIAQSNMQKRYDRMRITLIVSQGERGIHGLSDDREKRIGHADY